jgi:hypothetical protein
MRPGIWRFTVSLTLVDATFAKLILMLRGGIQPNGIHLRRLEM